MNGATIYSLALAIAAPFVKAAPPLGPGPVRLFYVSDFHTVCTGTSPQHQCETHFNVTYENSNEYRCSLDGSETNYVGCFEPGPEYSMAAYIRATETKNKHFEQDLKLRFDVQVPGEGYNETFGSTVLMKNQPQNFSVAAVDHE